MLFIKCIKQLNNTTFLKKIITFTIVNNSDIKKKNFYQHRKLCPLEFLYGGYSRLKNTCMCGEGSSLKTPVVTHPGSSD